MKMESICIRVLCVAERFCEVCVHVGEVGDGWSQGRLGDG